MGMANNEAVQYEVEIRGFVGGFVGPCSSGCAGRIATCGVVGEQPQ
jgi:hypothetical protein